MLREVATTVLGGTGSEGPSAPRDFRQFWRSGHSAADAYAEAIDFQREAMRRSPLADPFEALSLERTARIAAMLVKSADPKRMLDEKDAALRDAAQDIAELEARVHSESRSLSAVSTIDDERRIQVGPADHGGPGAPSEH